jgi:RNA polymerase sigma factor (sigma-70 family)
MSTALHTYASPVYDLRSEKTWVDLINWLHSYVRYLVYSAHVPRWHGQEEDIVEDIVQETARRIIAYAQRAEHGEVLPIYSPKHMIAMIARNYCIDMQRRDRRLQHSPSDTSTPEYFPKGDQMSLLELATEHISQEEIFARLAHEIVHFPKKQRQALLVDLANRMHFDTQLTSLQKAFLMEGIDLKAYQLPLPADSTERGRQAALASLAYKRVAKCMHEFTLDEWEKPAQEAVEQLLAGVEETCPWEITLWMSTLSFPQVENPSYHGHSGALKHCPKWQFIDSLRTVRFWIEMNDSEQRKQHAKFAKEEKKRRQHDQASADGHWTFGQNAVEKGVPKGTPAHASLHNTQHRLLALLNWWL